MKIAYQGTIGAYSYLVTTKLFPNDTYEACRSFAEVFKEVYEAKAAYGVIPIENSYVGEVGEVLDLLYQYPLYIHKITDLKINHVLVGLKGTSKEKIKKVYSHPQALAQCSNYLVKNSLEAVAFSNTAVAASYLANKGKKDEAAIASRQTALEYGLEILDENITDHSDNTTRFIVISKAKPDPAACFSFIVTVKNGAGTLAPIINEIASLNIDLTCLKSRSCHDKLWDYFFYFEALGSYQDSKALKLADALEKKKIEMKIIGSYNKI